MRRLTKVAILAAAMMAAAVAEAAAGLTFTGSQMAVLEAEPAAQSGLGNVYVLYQTQGVEAVYTAASPTAEVRWYKYSLLGGGFAEELTAAVTHAGKEWRLQLAAGDMGYIVEEGDSRYCCWVVDYSAHRLEVRGIEPVTDGEDQCGDVTLRVDGSGDRIYYTGIAGTQHELSRRIRVTYQTLVYDQEDDLYLQDKAESIFAWLPETIHTKAPLCDTRFTLRGDTFLQQWGYGLSVTSGAYTAVAVEAATTATAEGSVNANEQTVGGGSALGGSAPAVIRFSAAVTDAVVFKEWQFSRYPDFDVIDLRVNDLDVTRTFDEQGSTYARFVAANADGDCEHYGETYQVFIGDSALECPNVFSPGASPGVNDEWKVSYKSIVEFECHIFNRYGTKMCAFRDPAKGWDGKYGGKLVPAGVYYYVINAKGADGRVYKLSGDINIINYK